MRLHPNLPRQQWLTQNLVDQFNADEVRWRKQLLRRLKQMVDPGLADDLRLIIERMCPIERDDT